MSASIPIVLATDENYAPYVYTTMVSCMKSKNESSYYEFYIMIPEQFRDAYISEFMQFPKHYCNCSVHLIDMKGHFKEANLSIAHITTPTYYRLVIASTLNHCDKAIYLDSDVIVKADLTEYYEQNLDDSYVGGVKAIGYIRNKQSFPYYKNLGLNSLDNYINAGVTLWNLRKIREHNMEPTLLALAEKSLRSMDQDAINIAFKDKIMILPLKYNMITRYMAQLLNLDENPEYSRIYGLDNIKEAIEHPIIIHYADKIKPWQDSSMPYAADWWETARHLPFLFQHEITTQHITKILIGQQRENIKEKISHNDSISLKSYIKFWIRYRITSLKATFTWGKRRKKYLLRKQELRSLKRKYRIIA